MSENPKKYYLLRSHTQADYLALWWRPDAAGYTTQLEEAGLYDEETARKYRAQETIPVPIEEAQKLASLSVPVDRVRHLFPPVAKPSGRERCAHCPRFIKRGGWLCRACQAEMS